MIVVDKVDKGGRSLGVCSECVQWGKEANSLKILHFKNLCSFGLKCLKISWKVAITHTSQLTAFDVF